MSAGKPLFPPLPNLPPMNFAREFEFTEQDFERIRNFIHRKAGIALNPTKKIWYMVVSCAVSVN